MDKTLKEDIGKNAKTFSDIAEISVDEATRILLSVMKTYEIDHKDLKGGFKTEENIDIACNCLRCEENHDGKCQKLDSRFIDCNNTDLGWEYYHPFCDYRNQPELRLAYDDGFDDGYSAAY
jgi:hypothetical protein